MEFILDTHVLLWSMFEPAKLSKSSQKILLDKNSQRAIHLVYAVNGPTAMLFSRLIF